MTVQIAHQNHSCRKIIAFVSVCRNVFLFFWTNLLVATRVLWRNTNCVNNLQENLIIWVMWSSSNGLNVFALCEFKSRKMFSRNCSHTLTWTFNTDVTDRVFIGSLMMRRLSVVSASFIIEKTSFDASRPPLSFLSVNWPCGWSCASSRARRVMAQRHSVHWICAFNLRTIYPDM